jgi:hypothetical protein
MSKKQSHSNEFRERVRVKEGNSMSSCTVTLFVGKG